MKTLGIHIKKGELRYSVLKGTKDQPELVVRGRLIVPKLSTIPELMNWFNINFKSIINSYEPDEVAYRLTLSPNKEQLFNLEFPMGILNHICYELEVPIKEFSNSGNTFSASKLGLDKSVDIYDYCDQLLRDGKPYWDKDQKYSILVAWFILK